MENNIAKIICAYFSLGTPFQPPEKVYGGFVHTMWRVATDKASYAIKQLSEKLMLEEPVIKNYELTEHIAASFATLGIPTVSAIEKDGKCLLIIDGTGFLVYPWVEATTLASEAISESHALKMAEKIAKIHLLNLQKAEAQLDFCTNTEAEIITLLDKAESFACPFTKTLRENLGNILAANKAYQSAIPILSNELVVSHRDLHQKNVLWDENEDPIIIDWEVAGKINSTSDIINTALFWSGITTIFNEKLFCKMLDVYQKVGGVINLNHLDEVCHGTFFWIDWLLYNINRSCVNAQSEDKTLAIEQVNEALAAILQLQKLMPKLIKMIAERSARPT
jgi:thiamine kinase-like enzyme